MKKRSRLLYCFYDAGHLKRFLWGLLVLSLFADLGLIFVPQAYAANFCTGATANQNLFAIDTIANKVNDENGTATTLTASNAAIANSDPYTSGACAKTLGIFGRVLCFFKTTIGQIESTMYCNFQNALLGPLSICIELAIAIFGLFFISGMTNMNVREGITALLKIALVWAFAMNADWGIGIGYSFFMGIAEEGTKLVLSAAGSGESGGQYLTSPDKIIDSVFNYTSVGNASGNPLTLPATLSSFCALMLFFFFVLLLIALPTMGGAILAMMIQYLWLYVRALLGYLTALVLIGFLFILAPLFISFALFKTTRPLFEKWLQYLTAFSLQVVIIFGFIALLGMIPIGDFFMEILSLVRQYDVMWTSNGTPMPKTLCSVCKYTQPINYATALGGGPPYPITCVNPGATGGAIPLSQLLTANDLVQAVVAQAMALWIIANVMLDFMKRAPDFATQLSGRLPFASILGGSATSASGAESINLIGEEWMDQQVEGLSNKLQDPSTYKGWMRVMPAGLLGAMALPTLARAAKNDGSSVPIAAGYDASSDAALFGGRSTPTPTAGAASDPNNPLSTPLSELAPGAFETAAGKNAGQTTMGMLARRAALMASGGLQLMPAPGGGSIDTTTQDTFTSTSSQGVPLPATAQGVQREKYGYRLQGAQQKLGLASARRDENYEKALGSYQTLVRLLDRQKDGYVVDPVAFRQALLQLKDEDYPMYLAAETGVGESRARVDRERNALKEQAPDLDLAPKLPEVREAANKGISGVQLQLGVTQVLNPDKNYGHIENAIGVTSNNFRKATTVGGFTNVLGQIGEIESWISGQQPYGGQFGQPSPQSPQQPQLVAQGGPPQGQGAEVQGMPLSNNEPQARPQPTDDGANSATSFSQQYALMGQTIKDVQMQLAKNTALSQTARDDAVQKISAIQGLYSSTQTATGLDAIQTMLNDLKGDIA